MIDQGHRGLAAELSSRASITHLAVVVPAANEQDRIGVCLAALITAQAHLHGYVDREITVDIVVVLDRCLDGTAAAVAQFPDVRTVSIAARNVGRARAAGTAAVLTWPTPLEQTWTAHTDADSIVPPHWLLDMVRAAERGFDVVLGTVVPDADLDPARRQRWNALHDHRAGHQHVHGANLSIRASALHSLGGWRPLPTGEDVDLAARAELAGLRVLRTASAPVTTSTRLSGRAPAGFSRYLRDLDPAQ